MNLMERDHIRVHLAPSVSSLPPPCMLHDGLFISQALRGKVSGVWAIQMSRKVVSADGQTLGVAGGVAESEPFHRRVPWRRAG